MGGIGGCGARPSIAHTSALLSALPGKTIWGFATVEDHDTRLNPPAAVALSWHPLIAHEILKRG